MRICLRRSISPLIQCKNRLMKRPDKVEPEPDAASILDLRTRRLNEQPVSREGCDYVLCWLTQALRAEENPALDAAIALGNELELPVVVLHTLENRYPYASHRLHRFILEASRDLEAGVRARGLRFVRWVRREGEGAEGAVDLVARLAERAAAVVVDDVPTFVTHEYAEVLSQRLKRAVYAVDACCAVPMNALAEPLDTTKAFRAAHTKLRPLHLNAELRQVPSLPAFEGDLEVSSESLELDEAGLDALIRETGVDMSVPPAPGFSGSRSAALARLEFAVREVVPRYKWTRNNPALEDATAKLSPWLHFGVLSPREVARAVLDAEAEGKVHAAARWKFFDEFLTWRECYHHRARHEANWDQWEGLPEWARDTLQAHADDPRPNLYSLDTLIHGETDDETWNAAQKGFLLDGWLNNNLRMYWVKQLLRWRATPQEAWATACYLNDRFSLDGRDASTYGGIRWGFGEGKKGYREIEMYGEVAPKSDRALRRREGVPEWLEEQAKREVYRVEVPEDEAAALAHYL